MDSRSFGHWSRPCWDMTRGGIIQRVSRGLCLNPQLGPYDPAPASTRILQSSSLATTLPPSSANRRALHGARIRGPLSRSSPSLSFREEGPSLCPGRPAALESLPASARLSYRLRPSCCLPPAKPLSRIASPAIRLLPHLLLKGQAHPHHVSPPGGMSHTCPLLSLHAPFLLRCRFFCPGFPPTSRSSCSLSVPCGPLNVAAPQDPVLPYFLSQHQGFLASVLWAGVLLG